MLLSLLSPNSLYASSREMKASPERPSSISCSSLRSFPIRRSARLNSERDVESNTLFHASRCWDRMYSIGMSSRGTPIASTSARPRPIFS